MKTLFRAEHIAKTFITGAIEVHAIADMSFQIYAEELIVILGPSGSGKSTLLNIIGGIEPVSSGEAWYEDFALHAASPQELNLFRRKNIGFVFQFYNLLPHLTALENVELAAELTNDPLDPVTLIKQVGLPDRANEFPGRLSGGQQQRVAIARAIAKNPQLLLCDEPTGALDIKTGVQILDILHQFNRKYHKNVIIITHNTAIAKIADRVFHIRDGLIEQVEVNQHPLKPEEVTW